MDYTCSIRGCTEPAVVTFSDVIVTATINKKTRRFSRVVHICLNHLTTAVGAGR